MRLVEEIVGFNYSLYQRMTDYVTFVEIAETNSIQAFEDLLNLNQTPRFFP